jgi:hypothetical protein
MARAEPKQARESGPGLVTAIEAEWKKASGKLAKRGSEAELASVQEPSPERWRGERELAQ